MKYFAQGKLGSVIDSLSHESLKQIIEHTPKNDVLRRGCAWERILERYEEFENKNIRNIPEN